ncbi:hypothetical protein EJ08DRAFT_697171 [Tothia fuscella]|uniref:Uncharacterized protein n=1 Tax=Tothia fuscella TaxID=1048955 RepID=A0A9P4NSM0_9PEZI|nr:hypothetical protein EJ08DRAFT_697171 [Tothia fuscella]
MARVNGQRDTTSWSLNSALQRAIGSPAWLNILPHHKNLHDTLSRPLLKQGRLKFSHLPAKLAGNKFALLERVGEYNPVDLKSQKPLPETSQNRTTSLSKVDPEMRKGVNESKDRPRRHKALKPYPGPSTSTSPTAPFFDVDTIMGGKSHVAQEVATAVAKRKISAGEWKRQQEEEHMRRRDIEEAVRRESEWNRYSADMMGVGCGNSYGGDYGHGEERGEKESRSKAERMAREQKGRRETKKSAEGVVEKGKGKAVEEEGKLDTRPLLSRSDSDEYEFVEVDLGDKEFEMVENGEWVHL